MRGPGRLEFLTRRGCHLCEDALALVAPAARARGMELVVVDVDADDALLREFGLRIPVVRDAAGRVLLEGPMDRRSVTAALRRD